MFVATKADEQLDAAREGVKAAIAALGEIVVAECPGACDFNRTFRDTMQRCLNELMSIREDLR